MKEVIKMKMKKETLEKIVELLSVNVGIIKEHKEMLIETKNYNVLETRLAFDCYRSLPREFRDKVRREEDLKDRHIETGMKRALKQLGII